MNPLAAVVGVRELARIVPVVRTSDQERLNRLAEQGVVRRGVGSVGAHRRVKSLRAGLISDAVIDDRR